MKKGIRPNVDMFKKKKSKVYGAEKIKMKYYKFSVTCSCKSQNGMLGTAPTPWMAEGTE